MANGEAAEPDNRERESESGPDHVAKRIPEPPPHPALKYIFVTLPRLTVGTALLAGIAVFWLGNAILLDCLRLRRIRLCKHNQS
mgnify:CR=1 FL=1